MWLIEFLPGATLDTFRTTPQQREQVGEVLAKLRHATAGYSHPFDSRAIALDVQHIMALEPLLEFVENAQHHAALAQGLARLGDLQPRIRALRTQVLHNDFSKSNLLGDVTREDFVTGVIDTREKFEKHRYELATRVWTRMKTTDSHECRNCHNFNYMDYAEQNSRASTRHQVAFTQGQTCIDCHKGIAHSLPPIEQDIGAPKVTLAPAQ